MVLQNIRNIIFDLGDVIIDLNRQLALDEFEKLGVKNIQSIHQKISGSKLFDDFEKGLIGPGDFRRELNTYFAVWPKDAEFDFAWNTILCRIPKERIELLQRLSKNYRLFVLSNTDRIHINAIYNMLKADFALEDFSSIFEHCYYSFDLGLRKPSLEIYKTVLGRSNLDPNETLFLDDRQENIDAAEELRIRGCLISKQKSITHVFDI